MSHDHCNTDENNEMLVRCFTCMTVRKFSELTNQCNTCCTPSCGLDGCSGRCLCFELRKLEHPDEARDFYTTLDELNAGVSGRERTAALESKLAFYEEQYGW